MTLARSVVRSFLWLLINAVVFHEVCWGYITNQYVTNTNSNQTSILSLSLPMHPTYPSKCGRIQVCVFILDTPRVGSTCGLVVRIHDLCAVSRGFEPQKMVVTESSSDLNSLLSPNKVSLLTREHTP